MRKKHNYIYAKFKWLEETQTIKLMCNGAWFYVADMASLMLFDEIIRYFTEYHSDDINGICIPDKILFDCSKTDLLVCAYDGKRCMSSEKWSVLNTRVVKYVDADMLRFVNLFTPIGRGSAA